MGERGGPRPIHIQKLEKISAAQNEIELQQALPTSAIKDGLRENKRYPLWHPGLGIPEHDFKLYAVMMYMVKRGLDQPYSDGFQDNNLFHMRRMKNKLYQMATSAQYRDLARQMNLQTIEDQILIHDGGEIGWVYQDMSRANPRYDELKPFYARKEERVIHRFLDEKVKNEEVRKRWENAYKRYKRQYRSDTTTLFTHYLDKVDGNDMAVSHYYNWKTLGFRHRPSDMLKLADASLFFELEPALKLLKSLTGEPRREMTRLATHNLEKYRKAGFEHIYEIGVKAINDHLLQLGAKAA